MGVGGWSGKASWKRWYQSWALKVEQEKPGKADKEGREEGTKNNSDRENSREASPQRCDSAWHRGQRYEQLGGN